MIFYMHLVDLRALKSNPGIVITGKPESILAKRSTDSGWQVITVPEIIGSVGHLATLGYLRNLMCSVSDISTRRYEKRLERLF